MTHPDECHEKPVVLDRLALERLGARLTDTRAGPALEDWTLGVPRSWLGELLDEWRSFDPAALQRDLDGLRHVRVDVDGLAVHAAVTPGVGPDPLALVLTHGWPSTFREFADVVGPLADPAAHGGDPADAFTVVTPSLPGFAFGAAPSPPGLTARTTAHVWDRVMRALGHERYVAHGTDLGAGVTAWLGREHAGSVAAIHLATPGLAVPRGPVTDAERRFGEEVSHWMSAEGGYMHEHSTKPATLGVALADSPAGLAAWVAEKIVAWSPVHADGSSAYARGRLLENLTLYWATSSITTSLLPYWASRHDPESRVPPGDPAPTPTAITIFGGERIPFPKPPRQLAERYYTVTSWSEHERGGHFPAVAEPELFVAEIRRAFAPVRAAVPGPRRDQSITAER